MIEAAAALIGLLGQTQCFLVLALIIFVADDVLVIVVFVFVRVVIVLVPFEPFSFVRHTHYFVSMWRVLQAMDDKHR